MENLELYKKRRNFLKQSFDDLSCEISALIIRQNGFERELKKLDFELTSHDLEQRSRTLENLTQTLTLIELETKLNDNNGK